MEIVGTVQQIIVETVVNDFCSCSSIGKFDTVRGQKLKDMEFEPTKKPGAFITYHVPTLKKALKARLSKNGIQTSFKLVGKSVAYGQKDRHWLVEEDLENTRDADAVGIWLGIAFVKSPKFTHEEEFRLLLVDPSNAGGLDEKAEEILIEEDHGIVSAIHHSDYY